MVQLDEEAAAFLASQRVLSLAAASGAGPVVCNCFYALRPEKARLIFCPQNEPRMVEELARSPAASAAIFLEANEQSPLRGVQTTGRVAPASAADIELYYASFPYAREAGQTLWRLDMDWLRFANDPPLLEESRRWSRAQ
ncbi:MAG: pyridoxamine 5'-phosphate oxidase family protein [Leptospirales bacterium]|nr:pyridoxamine 5'-phosphate oxidase family protein [Leptospirales bacterium]